MRVAAEWSPPDLHATAALVLRGEPLSLDGLITPPRPGGLGPDRLRHGLQRPRLRQDDPGLETRSMSIAPA